MAAVSPTIETLEALAAALEVKPKDLLDEFQAGSDEVRVMTIVAAVRKLDRAKLEVAARQISALADLKDYNAT